MSKSMLFLCVETPLHAGSGRSLGTVDLPIQRERVTGYPMIQSSGIKGRLRAEMKGKMSADEWLSVFGPETDNAADFAGALSFGDARLLLFPVRSLNGVFAWCTSVDVLARFVREAALTGVNIKFDLPKDDKGQLRRPEGDQAWVSGERIKIKVNDQDQIVLEEFSFIVENLAIRSIADELVKTLPDGKEYDYWRQILPECLCILPEDAFRDFSLYATEVQTHIKLDPDKKTVASGALWTSESLPVDTILYAPLVANRPRSNAPAVKDWDEKNILHKITQANLSRINFGGDETTGQGFVALKFLGGEA